MATTKNLVGFTLTVAGEKQLDLRLGLLRTNVTDLTDLWPFVDEYLCYIEAEQFERQGARGGGGFEWAALKPGYALWKHIHYPGKPILVREGDLKKSLTQKGGDHIFKAGRLGMTFGTEVPYAIYHQTGVAETKLPARPPIKLLKKQDAVDIAGLIQRFIWKSGQGFERFTAPTRVL